MSVPRHTLQQRQGARKCRTARRDTWHTIALTSVSALASWTLLRTGSLQRLTVHEYVLASVLVALCIRPEMPCPTYLPPGPLMPSARLRMGVRVKHEEPV